MNSPEGHLLAEGILCFSFSGGKCSLMTRDAHSRPLLTPQLSTFLPEPVTAVVFHKHSEQL